MRKQLAIGFLSALAAASLTSGVTTIALASYNRPAAVATAGEPAPAPAPNGIDGDRPDCIGDVEDAVSVPEGGAGSTRISFTVPPTTTVIIDGFAVWAKTNTGVAPCRTDEIVVCDRAANPADCHPASEAMLERLFSFSNPPAAWPTDGSAVEI